MSECEPNKRGTVKFCATEDKPEPTPGIGRPAPGPGAVSVLLCIKLYCARGVLENAARNGPTVEKYKSVTFVWNGREENGRGEVLSMVGSFGFCVKYLVI